ncbi:PREDICTED: MATH domain and coiled-coil domain-containing protein At3g58280-like [Camelina sativa]|uniref:MATH domain and coiled-coil domain-containing protein At3g58280-like n=1 Tax=Camelina sativa TaxID=90675 RepID=A0ABM0YRD9_CAMSA|nr:PREDICTED: MATH domain and coiled-coil domain-containing protein At3g58280-like [Camelina sativa]
MVRNTECSESSDEEQRYSSSSEEWSESSEDVNEVVEVVEVNGFQILDSQVSQVKAIFEKHPDIASDFNIKNQQLKNAYMGVLLDLIMTLCQSSPKDLTMDNLEKADRTVLDLTKAGLKLHWLREKLDEAFLKKEKKRAIDVRIRELEEQVKKRKLNLSDLESDLKKQKAKALVAETPFDFSDVV